MDEWTVRRDGDLYYAVGTTSRCARRPSKRWPSASRSRARSSTPLDSIIVIDKNLKVVEASPSNDSTFAFSREETEGRGALDFVHPDDQGMILEVLERDSPTTKYAGAVPGTPYRRALGNDRVSGPSAS